MRALLRQAVRTTAPFGALAFWIGMLIAQRRYPSEYDWRYITMSSLVYPERNPDGFLWARAGIGLCGLAGLYWTAGLIRAGQAGGGGWRLGIWTLGLGYLCMSCCAVLPEQLLPIPRVHDLLALAAFVGICAGTALVTFTAVEQGRRRLGKLAARRRLDAGVLVGIALSPMVLAALTQAYVAHALPTLPWVNLGWRARGVPAYLSFAFWEWVTCAVLSAYMTVLSLAVDAHNHPRPAAKA